MSDLTDRMRTCAATLVRNEGGPFDDIRLRALEHAADLLIEASNALSMQMAEDIGKPTDQTTANQALISRLEVLGKPMEILQPVAPAEPPSDLWIAPGGQLPGLAHSGTISARACPQCGSVTPKKVRRAAKRMMIECPACTTEWPFQGAA
jgi:hypothetical protein